MAMAMAMVMAMIMIIIMNNQPYLVRVTLNSKADKPVALIYGLNWNLEYQFLWREENRRNRRKTLGAGVRTNTKLNPHMTPGLGIEPGPQRQEESTLTTAPSLQIQLHQGHRTTGTTCSKDALIILDKSLSSGQLGLFRSSDNT